MGGQALHDMSREQLTRWRSREVGYVFQLYHLMPILTAFENVELPLLLQNLSKKERYERVESVLDQVGLSDRLIISQENFQEGRNNGLPLPVLWYLPHP